MPGMAARGVRLGMIRPGVVRARHCVEEGEVTLGSHGRVR